MFYCTLHEIVGWCRLEAVWAMGHVGGVGWERSVDYRNYL